MDGHQHYHATVAVLPVAPRGRVIGNRDPHVDPRPLAATAALAGVCCAAAHPAGVAGGQVATIAVLFAGGAIWAVVMMLFAWALARRTAAAHVNMVVGGAWAMLAADIALDVPDAATPARLLTGALLGCLYAAGSRHGSRGASALILPFAPLHPSAAAPDQAVSTATSALPS